MIVKFKCQHCGSLLRCPETRLGRTATCAACQQAATSPSPEELGLITMPDSKSPLWALSNSQKRSVKLRSSKPPKPSSNAMIFAGIAAFLACVAIIPVGKAPEPADVAVSRAADDSREIQIAKDVRRAFLDAGRDYEWAGATTERQIEIDQRYLRRVYNKHGISEQEAMSNYAKGISHDWIKAAP